jgi:isocitrate lyase
VNDRVVVPASRYTDRLHELRSQIAAITSPGSCLTRSDHEVLNVLWSELDGLDARKLTEGG